MWQPLKWWQKALGWVGIEVMPHYVPTRDENVRCVVHHWKSLYHLDRSECAWLRLYVEDVVDAKLKC